MPRLFAVAASAAAMLALVPSASAQNGRRYYSAVPATAPAKASLITRSTVWKCVAGSCTAARSDARDTIMCELVARQVGQLTAFRADGIDFGADALAKCNAKAR